MKKRQIALVVGVFILSITMLIFFSGTAQMGGSRSTDMLFKETLKETLSPDDSEFNEDDLKSEEAERALEALLDDGGDYSELEASWPYTLSDLGTFLEAERASYGQASIMGHVMHFKISEVYDYDEDDGYSLESRRRYELPGSLQVVFDQKEVEYPFRIPWQVLAASRYIFELPVEKMLYESLTPDYVYSVPNLPYPSAVFANETASLEGEDIPLQNHIPAEKRSLYVPVGPDYEPLLGTPLDADTYMRVNGIEELKTVKIITTKWYKKNSEGKIRKRKTEKEREETREVTVELATPKPLIIRSMYGDNHFSYKREQISGQVIHETYKVKRYYNDDDELRKKVITSVKTVLTSDKMVEDTQQMTPSKDLYLSFFDEQMYGEEDAVFMLNLMSLLPGGSESAGLLGAGFEDGNVLYMRSDMNRSAYDTIQIRPSELELPIPRFFQNDSRWVSLPFGSSTVGRAGCGPTSAAMVITGLTGSVITPPEMCDIAARGGFKTSEGIAWSFFKYAANRFGLEVVQLSPTAQGNQTMLDMLSQGNPVIVSVHAGHFTSAGHIIVLTGITQDGKIEVNDPYDPYMTKNRAWNPAIILDEANAYFVIKNPNVVQSETGGTDESL